MIRITADIDSKSSVIVAYNIYRAFKYIEEISYIEIKKSNSKGFHLIVWTNKKYTLKKQYELRELIGDDKRRIKLDRKRKVGRNTLFYKKETTNPIDTIEV